MAAARTAGLSTDELQGIRDSLAAGRKPKVVFTESAGQIAGQTGQVVTLTDPTVSDEWVVVRFGRDELPFSPADLGIAPRVPAGRRAEAKAEAPAEAPAEPVASAPEFKLDQPPPAPKVAPEAPVVEPVAESKPARRPAKVAKPKASPGLTVTLAYAEGEWTVGATQGSKALAKPYVIKPAEALKMVALIDVPGVHEAVEQIVSAERAEAEQQAERLRSELAEIEARLAELRDAG